MDLIAKLKAAQQAKAALAGKVNVSASVSARVQEQPAQQELQVVQAPPEQPPAQPVLPAPAGGLKMPMRRVLPNSPAARKVLAAEGAALEQPVQLAAEDKPAGLQLGGALGALKAAADARSASKLAMTGVHPAAAAAVEAGEVYSAAQMLEELQALDANFNAEEADHAALEQLDKQRAAVLARGAAEIERQFAQHMRDLQITGIAADPAVAAVAQIVKLTFMRVKSAPSAWAFMALQDKASVIKGMRFMAEKRQAATQSRKKTDAKEYGTAMETMSAPAINDTAASVLAELGDLGFDIGGL